MNSALYAVLVAAATMSACKKSSTEGAGSGAPSAPADAVPPRVVMDASAPAVVVDALAAAALPAPLADFESVFVPLTKLPAGDARSDKTCEVIELLRVKSLAVKRYQAPGIDQAAWEELGHNIHDTLAAHGIACADGGAHDPELLASVTADYQKLLGMLGAAPLEAR